jgi:hypothetical protein
VLFNEPSKPTRQSRVSKRRRRRRREVGGPAQRGRILAEGGYILTHGDAGVGSRGMNDTRLLRAKPRQPCEPYGQG